MLSMGKSTISTGPCSSSQTVNLPEGIVFFSWTSEISNVQKEWRLWSQCVKPIAWLVLLKCGCFFEWSISIFCRLDDLDVFCELPSICCILLFWGGTTLDPGRIFPFLSLESPQALWSRTCIHFSWQAQASFQAKWRQSGHAYSCLQKFCNYVEPRWNKREAKPEETWGNNV